MSKNIKKIDRYLKGVVPPEHVSHQNRQQLRREVLGEIESKRISSKSLAMPGPPKIRRIIMKSPITKLTAAAVIIVFIIVMYRGNGTLDVASPAYGRIREALEKVTWMHTIHTRHIRDKGRTEKWILYDSAHKKADIDIRKYDGTVFDPNTKTYGGHISIIRFSNRDSGTATFYDRQTNTKIVTYHPKLFGFGNHTPSQSLVDTFLKNNTTNAETTRERGSYEDINADIYCTRTYQTTEDKNKQIRSEFRLIVDRDRYLPLATSYKYWRNEGTLFDDRDTKYYYPTTGPNDIHDLGAPRSAKVIDFAPTPDLIEAITKYREKRDESPMRYTAVLVHSNYDASSESYLISGIDRHYCDDYLQRADASWFKPVPEQQFRAEAGNSYNSIMTWWNDKAYEQLGMSHEYLDLYGEECHLKLFRPGGSKDWQVKYKGYNKGSDRGILRQLRYIVDRDVLSELGWTRDFRLHAQGSWKITVVDNDYARSKNLVCIEVLGDVAGFAERDTNGKRSLFYLNPQRDYICQKCEYYPPYNYVQFREVLEFGWLDSGQWYPKKIIERKVIKKKDGTIRQTDERIDVYLETTPEFPEGIFDPENLLQ